MKKLYILFILLIYLPVQADKIDVSLGKCVDGDTAIFIINNENVKVRFLAIDTPESVKPNTEVDPFGINASDYTCNKLSNANKIELEYDEKSDVYDKYNRKLAWIWVNDELLQNDLVKNGLAKVKYIYGDYKYISTLYQSQDEAINNKKGLWQDYIPNTYIVTFINDDKKETIKVFENDTIESISVKKDGYTFKGWYLNDKKYDFNTKVNSNITLIAKYDKDINYLELLLIVLGFLILISINPAFKKKGTKKHVYKR